jgi:hypothetical protein
MPLTRDNNGTLTLTCINECTPEEKSPLSSPSTMRRSVDWYVLCAVNPIPQSRFTFNEAGMPLRIYMCSECGYVEMYAGEVTDPDAWGFQDGSVLKKMTDKDSDK